tara:strand:+ start:236 stop:556 length:321 start_codon:yes stop_codon:yes gene_type:complete
MTEFEKFDADGNGMLDSAEYQKLELELNLEDHRMKIADENAKRDQQRSMIWFALGGMLLYPFSIVATAWAGIDQATESLTSIAGVYFVSVSALVGTFFVASNISKK